MTGRTAVPARTPWFPALEQPQVRLYLAGQAVSMLGSWVFDITLNLLVWQLTRSPALLGLVNFLLYGPGAMTTMLVSGRLSVGNARRCTLWVLGAGMLVALLMTALSFVHLLSMPVIMVLAVCRSLLSGVEMPSRQILVTTFLDDRERIASAVSMNTMVFLGARMTGPAIAGVMFAPLGPTWGFGVAVLGQLFMLVCVRHLKPIGSDTAAAPAAQASGTSGLRGAVRFLRGNRFGRLFLPVTVAVAFFGSAYPTLIPVLADRVFHDVYRLTGLFFGAAGAGALAASVLLSSRFMRPATQRLMVLLPWATVLALLGVGLSRHVVPTVLCLTALGFCTVFVSTGTNASLHRVVPAQARGGLIALFLVVFVGVIPLGQLFAGLVGQWLSAQATLWVSSCGLCVCLLACFTPRWRAAGRLELNVEKI